ncbi:MAG: transglutaminase-like cysteine peptidase [Pseudorhodoplanes sp.]|uniref:transglutaminase-like cysteine peptidase n=1 Tax=Pseudorhodoplanes sp. TaxID=1934341 RepID=UPI003D0C1564
MLRVAGVILVALACMRPGMMHAEEGRFQATSEARHFRLALKWHAATRRMSEDEFRLAACVAELSSCDDGETRLRSIIEEGRSREGRARIGGINRAVNLMIRPASDVLRFGVADHWASPLETVSAGAGDCEDYAILKLLALQAAGIARDDLRMIIVHDHVMRRDHAVAAARVDGRWLLLDNRTFALVDLADTRYRVLAQLSPDVDHPHYAALETAAPQDDGGVM